ncbi:4-hydroxy-tetrahydrodipicolinate reductase [uncultured Amnibacterium sp.]|uniref:4-hydroxy-tetrahydrodipicolinate reductase n=1 Tax=uncultured Amnibacterium sp. TaxID=1631851 RepID=UPI0035C9590D
MIRLAVVGASGRMGRLIEELAADLPDVQVLQRLGSADALEFASGLDAVVDVTLPQVSPGVVRAATDAGLPVLVGTSGWTGERIASLRAGRDEAAPAVLIVPNFSVGAVLAARFAEQAAVGFESIEIVEAHHAGKADSPSGTAVATAERIAAARAGLGPVAAPHTDQRARGQQVGSVPIHSLRLEGVQAQQSTLFGGPGELLTVRHETTSPVAYAAGIRLAIRALPGLSGVVVGLEPLLLG